MVHEVFLTDDGRHQQHPQSQDFQCRPVELMFKLAVSILHTTLPGGNVVLLGLWGIPHVISLLVKFGHLLSTFASLHLSRQDRISLHIEGPWGFGADIEPCADMKLEMQHRARLHDLVITKEGHLQGPMQPLRLACKSRTNAVQQKATVEQTNMYLQSA